MTGAWGLGGLQLAAHFPFEGPEALPARDTPLWGTPCHPRFGPGDRCHFFFPEQEFFHTDIQLYKQKSARYGDL